jgi:hypothetical protein
MPPPRGVRAVLGVLGWSGAIVFAMTVVVSLSIVGQTSRAALSEETEDARSTVAAVAASFLACADLALASALTPAALAVCTGVCPMTLAAFSSLQLGQQRPFGYVEAALGERAATWAARMSSEYGYSVVPGPSCDRAGADLVVSYCGGGGGGCDPPLFECLDPASAAGAAAQDALSSGAARGIILPSMTPGGNAGLYQVFAPVAGRAALLMAPVVDFGALLAPASGVGSFNDVSVSIADVPSDGGAAVVVYAQGVAASAASLVQPVTAMRTFLGRNLSVSVAPGAAFVAAYTSARGQEAAMLMVLVPVRCGCCRTESREIL